MPTYDYECTKCGYTFEAFQNMSDEPLTKCPECGKKVRRLIGGGIGIIFKGSGFYVTDNKSGGKNGSSAVSAGNGSGKKEGDKVSASSDAQKSGSADSKSEKKSDSSGESGKSAKTGGKKSA